MFLIIDSILLNIKYLQLKKVFLKIYFFSVKQEISGDVSA